MGWLHPYPNPAGAILIHGDVFVCEHLLTHISIPITAPKPSACASTRMCGLAVAATTDARVLDHCNVDVYRVRVVHDAASGLHRINWQDYVQCPELAPQRSLSSIDPSLLPRPRRREVVIQMDRQGRAAICFSRCNARGCLLVSTSEAKPILDLFTIMNILYQGCLTSKLPKSCYWLCFTSYWLCFTSGNWRVENRNANGAVLHPHEHDLES